MKNTRSFLPHSLPAMLAMLLVLALFGSRAAAAEDDVEVTMQAFKIVAGAKGADLVPTTAAQPGDTIEYQVAYRNHGKAAARQVVATLPVPANGMAYLPDSAAPTSLEASLDGKQFHAVPLTRLVLRNGRQETELVPASEYRFLRWKLGELPPGQSITVKSRMRLHSTVASAATHK